MSLLKKPLPLLLLAATITVSLSACNGDTSTDKKDVGSAEEIRDTLLATTAQAASKAAEAAAKAADAAAKAAEVATRAAEIATKAAEDRITAPRIIREKDNTDD